LLKESLLVLAIIILFCFLVWLLKDTPPFSLLYSAVAPIIAQLQTMAQSLLAGPLGLWQQAETQIPWIDDAVKMGSTGAIVSAAWRYLGRKGEALLKKTKSELDNHTSENETLKEANTQLQEKNETILSLTSDLQSGYEAKLKTQQTEFDAQLKAKDEQIQTEIQKRITAEQNLTQKTQDKILEQTRKH